MLNGRVRMRATYKIGLASDYNPRFDKIVVGQGNKASLPSVVGVPLSRMIIILDNRSTTVGQSSAFQMDNMLSICTTGDCPPSGRRDERTSNQRTQLGTTFVALVIEVTAPSISGLRPGTAVS